MTIAPNGTFEPLSDEERAHYQWFAATHPMADKDSGTTRLLGVIDDLDATIDRLKDAINQITYSRGHHVPQTAQLDHRKNDDSDDADADLGSNRY